MAWIIVKRYFTQKFLVRIAKKKGQNVGPPAVLSIFENDFRTIFGCIIFNKTLRQTVRTRFLDEVEQLQRFWDKVRLTT